MAEQRKKLRLGELLVQQGLITLDQLGIASIDLDPGGPAQRLADGSIIQGLSTFTRTDGTTGVAGDVGLAYQAAGDAFLAMLERDTPLSPPEGFGPGTSAAAAALIQAMAIHSADRGLIESRLAFSELGTSQPGMLAPAWHP